MNNVTISFEADPQLQLATHQLHRKFLRRIVINNSNDVAFSDVKIHVALDPEFAYPKTIHIDRIAPNSSFEIPDSQLEIPLRIQKLADLIETQFGHITVSMESEGQIVASATADLHVHAFNLWPGTQLPYESLAAFVTPNHPALGTVIDQVRAALLEAGANESLEGYQQKSPARVLELTAAVYRAVHRLQIAYANPPAGFHDQGQKIRGPEQVIGERLGTCLDLTLLMAATLERIGLHPLVVVVENHAFPGVWLHDWSLPTTWVADPLPLKKRIPLAECVLFEATSATSGTPFKAACDLAAQRLNDTQKFLFALDIRTCRDQRITPFSLLREGGYQASLDPKAHPTQESDAWMAQMKPHEPGLGVVLNESPSARIERWKTNLLDLTLRNRMLSHRDSNQVLPIYGTKLAALEDILTQKKKLELVARPKTGTVDDVDLLLENSLKQGRVPIDLTPAEFEKRVVHLFRKNRLMIQDSGVSALFLSVGTLTWYESPDAQTPRFAPLILIPVTLERQKVGGVCHLVRSDDDPLWNASLFKKLEADFGINSQQFGSSPPADEAGVDVDAALKLVLNAIKDEPRFDVSWQASITFYQFQKFMMWLDLEQNSQLLLENDTVRHIVEGSEQPFPNPGQFPDVDHIDQRPAAQDLSVVDADSSQLAAIFSALEGNSFVLQGPPGTGKSQTITNLIAQALGRGKTVLFVSEKRAALEVVESRLKNIGLGPFTLEVHSDQASKSEVVRQLQEPLKFSWPQSQNHWEEHAKKLAELRTRINEHVQHLHEPGPFGESLFQVVSRLIQLDANGAPIVELDRDEIPDKNTYEVQRTKVAELAIQTRHIGAPTQHPWSFVTLDDPSVDWIAEVHSEVHFASQVAQKWIALGQYAIGVVADGASLTPESLNRLSSATSLLTRCPTVTSALLTDNRAEIEDFLTRLTAPLAQVLDARTEVQKHFDLALIEQVDLPAERSRFARWANAFFLFAFFMLFFARGRLKAYAIGALPSNPEILEDLQQAERVKSARTEIEALENNARRLFGFHWKGADTDPQTLLKIWSWTVEFRLAIASLNDADPSVAASISRLAVDSDQLAPETPCGKAILDYANVTAEWEASRQGLISLAGLDARWQSLNAEQQIEWLNQAKDQIDTLQPWCDWLRQSRTVREHVGDALVDALLDERLNDQNLVQAYERAVRHLYWRVRSNNDANLRQFRGQQHERLIERFREVDHQAKDLARKEIQARLASRLPAEQGAGEMEVLRNEFKKQRGHKSVRKLFAEVPNVLLRLKPCVLMSPLSVARFLDPRLQLFDIVVFDEASQIPPWDAIGAVARGKQAIIVGDSRQLPPTSFFSRSDAAEDEVEDDDDRVDLESILDQAVVRGVPQMTLNWHYRSRHESLIAFSNHHYYENRLHVFPSPHHDAPQLGLKWVEVSDGFYDRGGSRTNRQEAQRVVDEIVRRLSDPELSQKSLGVVTFSSAQQRAVDDLMDEKRRQFPQLEKYFGAEVPEPVFIKNLENVQGDERDVMLFSIGYGPDQYKKVTQNYGPLNRPGGERRLNVAVTRARELLVVFSTLKPEHIDPNRASNPGVHHLKTFLDYAARGHNALLEVVQVADDRGFGSPFEEQVYDVLVAHGWTVHKQVGVGGFFIDLAVVHPDHPGSYLLGIECDGASYHSAKSARDRDRIRQTILENLGWKIHRIWSTDWWIQRNSEVSRLLENLKITKDNYDKNRLLKSAFSAVTPVEPLPPERPQDAPTTGRPDFIRPWNPLPELPEQNTDFHHPNTSSTIVNMLELISNHASPVTLPAAARHLARAWNTPATKRLQARVAELAVHSKFHVEDDVIWRSIQQRQSWKGFRHHDQHTRDFEDVPEAEVQEAALWVVGSAVSISREEFVREVSRAFGYQRAGAKIEKRVEATLENLLKNQKLRVVDDKILLG